MGPTGPPTFTGPTGIRGPTGQTGPTGPTGTHFLATVTANYYIPTLNLPTSTVVNFPAPLQVTGLFGSIVDQSLSEFYFTDGIISFPPTSNVATSVYRADVTFNATVSTIGDATSLFVRFSNLPTVLNGLNYFYATPVAANDVFDISFSFSQTFTPSQIGNAANFGFSLNFVTSLNQTTGRVFILKDYTIVVRKLYSG
jgi:hypothetical protein